MKQIITLIACLLCFTATNAQSTQTQITGSSVDTVAGGATGTYYMVCKGAKSTVTFQYNVAKISGTLAGTIKLYGSIETTPTNYVLIDTYNLTDASSIGGYVINYNGYTKYKIVVGPTGTNSASYDIWGLYR